MDIILSWVLKNLLKCWQVTFEENDECTLLQVNLAWILVQHFFQTPSLRVWCKRRKSMSGFCSSMGRFYSSQYSNVECLTLGWIPRPSQSLQALIWAGWQVLTPFSPLSSSWLAGVPPDMFDVLAEFMQPGELDLCRLARTLVRVKVEEDSDAKLKTLLDTTEKTEVIVIWGNHDITRKEQTNPNRK